MKLSDHKGLIYTILYYLIGLLTSYIIYLIFGWEYIHSPGFHHLTFLLFLIIGFIWSLINIILFFKKKASFYKESLIVHSVIFGGILIWIIAAFISVESSMQNPTEENANSMILINRNDTSLLINEKKDTIYLKVNDSIYIDNLNK
jgi:hypothetical protein